MKSLLMGALLLVAPLSFGMEIAVKVKSQFCGSDRFLVGSGWIVQSGQDVYVVSSEHVILHGPGNDGLICHSVQTSQGWLPSQLLITDWGNGLALLKVNTANATLKLTQLNEVNAFSEKSAELSKMSVYGSPARADSLYQDHLGRLLSTKSNRHLIPILDKTYELIGAHGEFGMSGGPVVADGNPRVLVGILSHQYIEQKVGQAAQVKVFDSVANLQTNHLILIPGDFVLNWVKSALAHPKTFSPSFVRTLDPTSLVSPAVQTSGLIFKTMAATVTKSSSPRKSGEVGGEGGGSGRLSEEVESGQIGGEGGGTAKVDQENPIQVSVELGEGGFPTEWYLPVREDWLKKIKDQLAVRTKVQIPFLLERNPNTHRHRKVFVFSLGDFFNKLKNPQVIPAMALSGPIPGDFEKRNELLLTLAKQMKPRLQTLLEKQKADPMVSQFLLQIQDMMGVVDTDGWLALTEKDFRSSMDLDGPEANIWKKLFAADFDRAVELRKDLDQLNCLSSYRCSR